MIEVELKCELPLEAEARLRNKLQQMKFHGSLHNFDIYYDTPGFDLFKKAVFVRLRNHEYIQFKFNEKGDQAHVQSKEYAFPLVATPDVIEQMNRMFSSFLPSWNSSDNFEAAIRQNNLIVLASIDNKREIYSLGEMTLSLDHVEGIGKFLEVEIICQEGTDTEETLAHLKRFVLDFDVQPVAIGYVEMWLCVHKPHVYDLGKYQIKEQ